MEQITPNTPHIFNVAMATADTEYSQVLPEHTKKFTIFAVDSDRKRNHSDTLKISFDSGLSSFIPIPPSGVTYVGGVSNGSFSESGVNLRGKTLYFQSPTGNCYAIIMAWT